MLGSLSPNEGFVGFKPSGVPKLLLAEGLYIETHTALVSCRMTAQRGVARCSQQSLYRTKAVGSYLFHLKTSITIYPISRNFSVDPNLISGSQIGSRPRGWEIIHRKHRAETTPLLLFTTHLLQPKYFSGEVLSYLFI